MISSPPSATVILSRNVPGKPSTGNDNPAFAAKRCFSLQEEDQLALKRRHVHPDSLPSKRTPLDPLSASDLENRRIRRSQSADSLSYHSLVMPSSLPDPGVLHPEQPLSSGIQLPSTSGDPFCSWPPPVSTGRSPHSSSDPAGQQVLQCRPLHSFDENQSSRATFFGPSDPFQTEHTTTMAKPVRTTEWKSEDMLQPVRLRTSSLPSVHRPPRELWRSGCGLTEVDHESVDAADLLLYPTPPGLPLPSELRRDRSDSDPPLHSSVSLSLALGSQPLKASEPTKAVLPIGAERSRVVSSVSSKLSVQNSALTASNDPSQSPWCSPPIFPGLQPKWKNDVVSSCATSLDEVQVAIGYTGMSKEDLQRLLRHAAWNKHASKIISPLNPLRAEASAFDLSTDPTYQLRMPSQSNHLSPRYSKCLPRRARTLCDSYQSLDWDIACMHCQECKRDTVCKRLLALRYRQRRSLHVQRNKPQLTLLCHRGATASAVDDDQIARHIREAFAYDMDDEEKSLWEEVAAVTGAPPPSFSRVKMPCAVAYRRVVDEGCDEVAHDDYLEMLDEGMRVNESATLFRDVSVY